MFNASQPSCNDNTSLHNTSPHCNPWWINVTITCLLASLVLYPVAVIGVWTYVVWKARREEQEELMSRGEMERLLMEEKMELEGGGV